MPDNREPGLQKDNSEQDQLGGEDSVPEDDYLDDATCEIADNDEQLRACQAVQVCRVEDNADESIRREDQAV